MPATSTRHRTSQAHRRRSSSASLRHARREARNFGFAVMAGLMLCVGLGAASVGVVGAAVNGRV